MKMPEAVAWWVAGADGLLDMSDVPIQYKEERPLESLVTGCWYMALFTEAQLSEALAQQEAVMRQALDALEEIESLSLIGSQIKALADRTIASLEEALK